jgi:hypothetical protein
MWINKSLEIALHLLLGHLRCTAVEASVWRVESHSYMLKKC